MEDPYYFLELRAPLVYAPISQGAPFPEEGEEEMVVLFDLEPQEARSFDPIEERYFASQGIIGVLDSFSEEILEIPAGKYFFLQIRHRIKKEELFPFALDLQREGLWRRLSLAPRLYLRFLEEEGAVTQLFRPLL
ncbi:MAG: hypothetical protein N2Z76_05400 [Treponemataceae bacterium]|nr:hypothetical protein [Treponemataceae bacterium]